MKTLSKLGIICSSILGCNFSCVTASSFSSEHPGSDFDVESLKSNTTPAGSWYAENKIQDEYKGLRPDSSYRAISISKLSEPKSYISKFSDSSIPARSLTASESVIFDVADPPKDKNLRPKQTDEKDFYSEMTRFFEKHKNPEYLVIFECDGITQTMHALNAQKAFTNIYWNNNKDLGIWNKVSKWVGISYGCTLAGANVGKLADATDITDFNSISDNIFNHLKEDRLSKNKWYSGFSNCLFNSCISCAKLKAENDDIAIIRTSQFDQATPKAVQRYIADYFPKYVDDRLVFLQSGKDRRRADPDYQKSYMSIIGMVNETAKANRRSIVKKNFGRATNIACTVIDGVSIPIAGKLIDSVGQLVSNNLKFKTIDDTEHCDAYHSMSDEILSHGTLKLIINVDNYDGDDVNSNLQIEYKPQDNKLKYRLTINIPCLSYQDRKFDFERGYYRILDYLNSDQVSFYLAPLFKSIHGMNDPIIKEKIGEEQ